MHWLLPIACYLSGHARRDGDVIDVEQLIEHLHSAAEVRRATRGYSRYIPPPLRGVQQRHAHGRYRNTCAR